MPNFDKDFINSKGASIQYKGLELFRIDRIPVKKEFSGCLRVISTNSKWKQGIRMKIDGLLRINACEGKSFIIWADDVKGAFHFEGTSKKMELMVWNAWDMGRGITDTWTNGAAIIIEVNDNVRRYRCNDFDPDEDFDDIIFEIEIDELLAE